VLKHGGNAIDAAVATASTLGVTNPFVAGPGGGGFMVIYLAKSHQVVTIDGRETCPSACTPSMFIDPKTGQPLGYDYASDQPLATGVPSMVATWAKALRLYGRKSLAADLRPAIKVADRGFRVNADFRQLTESGLAELRAYPASRALLLTPAGNPLPVGYLLRNPDLARTYRLLGRHGPSYLYDGPLGRAIVHADDHPAVTPGNTLVTLPGIMTMSDLRAYTARVQAPTRVRYRGLDIYSMAPPSSSGSTVGEALNILSGYEPVGRAEGDGAVPLPGGIPAGLRRPRRLRRRSPVCQQCRCHGLLSPAFAATRRCLDRNQKALVSPVPPGDPEPALPGLPEPALTAGPDDLSRGTSTPTTSSRSTSGATSSPTPTPLTSSAAAAMTVPGYGFLLNNEMTDFDFAPPAPGVYDPNLPAGRKQPRSSMGPVIAFRDGTPVFSVGAAGGSTIITTILQIILNHVDFGMSLPAAVAAPRVSQTNSPTSLAEPAFYNSALRRQLTREFGEQFTEATGPILPLDHYPGDATALQILGHGRFEAIAEPVRLGGGSALVVNPSP
jgi:gamma-glutamyltranspeptidase/glutathione hydrolase